jgi:GTP-binding protein
VALSKIDLLPADALPELAARWRERLGGEPIAIRNEDEPLVLLTSSATGAGVDGLVHAIFAHTLSAEAETPPPGDELGVAEHAVYRPAGASSFGVERSGDHLFRITGASIERLVERHDLENNEALEYIEERLRAMGVVKALEASGFEPGDEIEIGEVAFALYPGVPQPD